MAPAWLPAKLGATLPRYADDALLVCRRSPQLALAAFEAIAKRMELTLNRDKTHVTRLTAGFDFVGFQFVKRKSPSSGKNTIDIFPAKSAQQTIRNRLRYLTSHRLADQPASMRGDGESEGDGVGQLLPAHERQPSLPRAPALRQYPFSSLRNPEK